VGRYYLRRPKSIGKEYDSISLPKEEMNRWVEKQANPLGAWIKKMESAGHSNARKFRSEAIRLVKEYSRARRTSGGRCFHKKNACRILEGGDRLKEFF